MISEKHLCKKFIADGYRWTNDKVLSPHQKGWMTNEKKLTQHENARKTNFFYFTARKGKFFILIDILLNFYFHLIFILITFFNSVNFYYYHIVKLKHLIIKAQSFRIFRPVSN